MDIPVVSVYGMQTGTGGNVIRSNDLVGVDHKKPTIRFGGRDMRLTDVHGEVVKVILA